MCLYSQSNHYMCLSKLASEYVSFKSAAEAVYMTHDYFFAFSHFEKTEVCVCPHSSITLILNRTFYSHSNLPVPL